MTKEQLSKPFAQQRQTRPALIRAAAIILFIYAIIETIDCITAALMAINVVSNPYPAMLFVEMQTMFDKQPIWLVPLFMFFTSLRLAAAIGLWQKKMWGFCIAVTVSLVTILIAPLLLPFTSPEMLLDGILLILLFIGIFGDTPISA